MKILICNLTMVGLLMLSIVSFADYNEADIAVHLSNIGKCCSDASDNECNLADCEDYKYIKQGLESEDSDFYLDKIVNTLKESEDSKLDAVLIYLLVNTLEKDDLSAILSDTVTSVKYEKNKLHSFFIITLIVACGIGLFLIYLANKIRKIKK